MIEQLKTIRHHLEPLKNNSGVRKALTALTQIEAMVAQVEPVASLMTNIQSGDVELVWNDDGFDRAMWHEAPLYTGAPVAQQPQAEPDAYCITTPDGGCISTVPRCMHQPQAEAVPLTHVPDDWLDTVDWPDTEDMAHSVLQEALTFGLSFDVINRFGRSVRQKTRDAMIAKTPQQAEAVPSDVVRMDWIAMHGSFGVDSVTGLPGGNGQKRIAATRAAIDAATAQGEKP